MVEPNNTNEWTLDFFTFPPEGEGWIHVPSSNYDFEEIYQHQVFTGKFLVQNYDQFTTSLALC